jgi:hypothetical protein
MSGPTATELVRAVEDAKRIAAMLRHELTEATLPSEAREIERAALIAVSFIDTVAAEAGLKVDRLLEA